MFYMLYVIFQQIVSDFFIIATFNLIMYNQIINDGKTNCAPDIGFFVAGDGYIFSVMVYRTNFLQLGRIRDNDRY